MPEPLRASFLSPALLDLTSSPQNQAAGVVVLIGLTNLAGLLTGTKKEAPRSTLPGRPSAANPAQVNSFETQQTAQARQDQEERNRQQTLAAQMAALQSEGAVPGPESTTAAPMTPAQRQANSASSSSRSIAPCARMGSRSTSINTSDLTPSEQPV